MNDDENVTVGIELAGDDVAVSGERENIDENDDDGNDDADDDESEDNVSSC